MTNYIPRLYDFFRQVEANNNRPWFAAHKEEYDELRQLWMADLDRLITAMTAWEPRLASQSAKSASYRFYRDTRFSADKSPYKLFFSAAISPFGRKSIYAGYYLETGIGHVFGSGLYGGLWMPDAAMLRKMRSAITDNIEEFRDIINAPEMLKYFPGWVGDSLKGVPKGWPKDHPDADLLRLKEYGKYCPCDEKFFSDPDWPLIAAERYHVLKPLVEFINYSLDEDTSF